MSFTRLIYMPKTIVIIFVLFSLTVFGQDCKTVRQQLESLNPHWKTTELDNPILLEKIELRGDVELIQMHLRLVIQKMKLQDISELSCTQKLNRKQCIDILEKYEAVGVFPKNLYHESRTPYFIDNFGTACAVGQLMINTGKNEFANLISKTNNNVYIRDLDSPELLDWADKNGLTMHEVMLIQPSYANGCSIDINTYLIQPSCNNSADGHVYFKNATGEPPYSIQFSESCSTNGWGTGITSGIYSMTVTDNDGNVTVQSETLVAPVVVIDSFTVVDDVCSNWCDASIEVYASATNSIAGYTFSNQAMQTSNTITGLCVGAQSFFLEDINGCTTYTEHVNINGPQTSSTWPYMSICFGDSVLVNGNYLLEQGIYTDTLISFTGCDSVVETTIEVVLIDTILTRVGDTLFAPVGMDAYQWYDCNSTTSMLGANANYYLAQVTGDYSVEILNQQCMETSSCYRVNVNVGIEAIEKDNFSTYPNPAKNVLSIEFEQFDEYRMVQLMDIKGQVLLNNSAQDLLLEIDMSRINSGIYFLHVETNSDISVVKIVRQ